MSETPLQPAPTNPDVRFEPSDARTRIILLTGAGMVVVLLVVQVLLHWIYGLWFTHPSAEKGPLSSSFAREKRKLPRDIDRIGRSENGTATSEPRLEVNPAAGVQEMRADEDFKLTSYGWVSKKEKIVRVPIAEAMDWLADPKKAAALGIHSRDQEKRQKGRAKP